MAYFFTRSYTYESGVIATSLVGATPAAHPASHALDYNKDSYWENDHASAELKIDLGVARTIDSLWMKHYNIDLFSLYHSPDGTNWTQVNDGTAGELTGYDWLFSFTAQTKRYWKIIITQRLIAANIRIYEVMLMQLRLNMTAEANLPSDVTVTPIDRKGGSYGMASGSAASFGGQFIKADIELVWDSTPSANYENLYLLYSTPVIRPNMTLIPTEARMYQIYRVLWKDKDFPFKQPIPYTDSGYSGTLRFMEY
jgi:hypothetical protein